MMQTKRIQKQTIKYAGSVHTIIKYAQSYIIKYSGFVHTNLYH